MPTESSLYPRNKVERQAAKRGCQGMDKSNAEMLALEKKAGHMANLKQEIWEI